jgi:hypothetical protein
VEVRITCVSFISLLLWHASSKCFFQHGTFLVFQVVFIGFALREFCLHKELKEIMITHYFFKLKDQIGQPHWPPSQFFSFGHTCFFIFASFIVLVIMNLC